MDAPDAPGAEEVSLTTWLQVKTPRRKRANPNLGIGESEVLDLTLELPGAVAILDDHRARRVAENREIPHTGTLGLLVHARKNQAVLKLRPLLNELKSYGFRIDQGLIEDALSKFGE